MKVTINNKEVTLTTLGTELVWVEKGTTNVLGSAMDLRNEVEYDATEECQRLGKAIFQARKDKGYTMDFVCAISNISKSSLNGYEKGRIAPNVTSLAKLEYLLDAKFLITP